MESQLGVGFIRCILRGAHPFLLYLSASEMIPTFTFTKNDLACFFFPGLLASPFTRNDDGTAPQLMFLNCFWR